MITLNLLKPKTKPHFNTGHIHTSEHRLKITQSLNAYYADHSGPNLGKTLSVEWRNNISKAGKISHKEHPRQKGWKASLETRAKMSLSRIGKRPSVETRERLRLCKLGANNPNFGKAPIRAKFIRTAELSHPVRSKTLELPFFLFLKNSGIPYEYEPERFELLVNGRQVNYWPDCKISGTNIYIECKGAFMGGKLCPDSITKMTEFRKQYPENRLFVVSYDRQTVLFPSAAFDNIFSIEKIVSIIPFLNEVKNAY